jgi:hypothetical protein
MKWIFLRMEREGRRVQDGIVTIAFMDIASDDESFREGEWDWGDLERETPFGWSRRVLGIVSRIGWEETVLCMIG